MGMPTDPFPVSLVASNEHTDEILAKECNSSHNLNYRGAIQTPKLQPTGANQQGNSQVKARYATHNGVSSIIFKTRDYFGVMAKEYKLTIVGKFLRARPQIEKIHFKFVEKISLKEGKLDQEGQNQQYKENANEQSTDDSTLQPQIYEKGGIQRSIEEDKSSNQEINFGQQSEEDMGQNNRNMDELNNLVERDDE
ncbi:hypothetical protein HAX54_035677 [Datura stramonium]|uniref:Uncharacterized protein n=1 Tax=Datura stramonium TaxID=4076 RepID=A0ABS8VJK1_DATST|nr:hypothetical protein [Datura stramonium]